MSMSGWFGDVTSAQVPHAYLFQGSYLFQAIVTFITYKYNSVFHAPELFYILYIQFFKPNIHY